MHKAKQYQLKITAKIKWELKKKLSKAVYINNPRNRELFFKESN